MHSWHSQKVPFTIGVDLPLGFPFLTEYATTFFKWELEDTFDGPAWSLGILLRLCCFGLLKYSSTALHSKYLKTEIDINFHQRKSKHVSKVTNIGIPKYILNSTLFKFKEKEPHFYRTKLCLIFYVYCYSQLSKYTSCCYLSNFPSMYM